MKQVGRGVLGRRSPDALRDRDYAGSPSRVRVQFLSGRRLSLAPNPQIGVPFWLDFGSKKSLFRSLRPDIQSIVFLRCDKT